MIASPNSPANQEILMSNKFVVRPGCTRRHRTYSQAVRVDHTVYLSARSASTPTP